MARSFTLRLVVWTVGLLLVHAGLRAVAGVGAPWPFMADLVNFAGPILAIGALAAGVGASGTWMATGRAGRAGGVVGLERQPGDRRKLVRDVITVAGAGAIVGLLSYAAMAWVTPAVMPAELAGVEPRASTSTEIRQVVRDQAANLVAGQDLAQDAASSAAWREVNIWSFEHERRIVQALLVPILALVGLMVGLWAGALGRELRAAAIWGVAFFIVVTLYLAGENGYELIVLRSGGPMAFVAWLQLIVPGALLVGLALPTVTWLVGGGLQVTGSGIESGDASPD